MAEALGELRALFSEALDHATPQEQVDYLDRACQGRPALRARVEALLRAHAEAGGFLQEFDGPVANRRTDAAPPAGREGPGTRVGPYQLLEQIGEGGMGVVWMAEQKEPVRRLVALKVLKPGLDSKAVLARFEAERQALALMDHPHIAKVHDAGAGDGGRLYFVMELVKGVPITKYCDEQRLTLRQRLELFVPVCQAIQHAHTKGVIHRDVKPSNVLVACYDGVPAPKVIDFGIAKATGQRLTEQTLVTGFGQVLGTLEYMSPEQAEFNALDIDTRSDVYSLGVLLYELLTGGTPLGHERLRETPLPELLRLIREEEAPKPSTRLSRSETLPGIAAARQAEPAQLTRLLRGELDWIVLKALEKDRTRRYETATSLARDVERYLRDEPVEACPPSAGYRLRKFTWRRRRALATAAAFGVLLLGGGAVAGWQAVRLARAERDQAVQQAQRSQETHAALARAAQLREQARSAARVDMSKWSEARAMARRAEALSETGPVEPGLPERIASLLRELEQEEKDRRMAAAVEMIRLHGADFKDESFDLASNGPRYAEAFRRYGVDMEALAAAEAGRRLRESAIREELLAALHDWAHAVEEEETTRKLYAVANVADDNPWRRQFRDCLEQKDTTRLRELTREDQVLRQSAPVLAVLGMVLERRRMFEEAVVLLREAQLRHPSDFWINTILGLILMDSMRPPKLDEAAGAFRAALALRPDSPGALLNLGVALRRQRKTSDAAACFQQALALYPSYVAAHVSLGQARVAQGDLPGARACFRRALDLDPHSVRAHYGISEVLDKQGDRPGAVASLRRALELNPKLVAAHHALGALLLEQGDLRGATASLRRALEIDPRRGALHYALSRAQHQQGDLRGAEASCRRAVELDASLFEAHYDLGRFAQGRGDWASAEARYRRAAAARPQSAEAHCNLGLVLLQQGDLRTALAELQTGHELGSQRREWRYPSARWLQECQRFLELEARLPLLLKEDVKPASAAERVELAKLCKYKKLYVSSARFCTEAFAADASLAGNFRAGLPYLAATSAALAGSGQGEEAARFAEAERGRLRRQALEWLRALLASHGTQRKDDKPSARQQTQTALYLWQNDPALAGVREADALAKLPADERAAWQQFWEAVAELQAKVSRAAVDVPK